MAMLSVTLMLPATAYSAQFPAKQCYTTLVGITSRTSGTTTHVAYAQGLVYNTGTWQNGSTLTIRSSVANHYHLTDSYGYGGRVEYTSQFDYVYAYCTSYSFS